MSILVDGSESHQTETQAKPLAIDWQIPDDLVTLFANNITVQFLQHEFVLTFYQTIPPPLLGPLAEQKLARMDRVPAVAVSRIVIAAGQLPGFVKALQDNLDKYLEATGEHPEDTE